MSVYDRWYRTEKQPDGSTKRVRSTEYGCARRWQVRWRDLEGTQRKRNFAKKAGKDPETHAEAFDAKTTNDLGKGVSVDLEAGRTTVKDYAAKWRADLLHRDSTSERLDRVFKNHVDPVIGHLRMSQVRTSHMRNWVKNRSQVLAASTLAVVWSNLASFFAAAVLDRAIGVSPCVGVRLPEVEGHAHFIPTRDQVHDVASRLPERYQAMAYVAAGCGLRGGEIMGLEIGAVDFLRREVDVSQQLVCVTGKAPYLGPPKTKTSARTVELPEVAATALARHLERFPPVEFEVDDLTDPRAPARRLAKLIFTTPRLNPIHRATWSGEWAPAARAAGIPRGTGLHCLRHYFATLLIHNGASVKTVQLALGHSTPTITLNTYVGEWPEAQERTRTIVDQALGNVPSVCPPEAARSGGRRSAHRRTADHR